VNIDPKMANFFACSKMVSTWINK